VCEHLAIPVHANVTDKDRSICQLMALLLTHSALVQKKKQKQKQNINGLSEPAPGSVVLFVHNEELWPLRN
jgi:hypothetical protein